MLIIWKKKILDISMTTTTFSNNQGPNFDTWVYKTQNLKRMIKDMTNNIIKNKQ